jgi:hypothetical protein
MGCCMKKMGLVQTNKDLSLRKKPRQARLSSQETAPTPTSATNKRHKSALVQSLADLASSAPTPNAQFSGLVSDDRLSPEVNDAHDMPMNSPYALVALRQHKQKLLKHTIVEDILAMHTRIQPLQPRSHADLMELPLSSLKQLQLDLEVQVLQDESMSGVHRSTRVTPYVMNPTQYKDAWQKSVPMLRPAPSHQVRSTAMFVTAPAIPEMEGTGEEEEAGAPLRDNRSAGVPLSTSDVASPFQAHSDSDFEPNTRQAPISPTSKGLSPGLRDPAAMPV